MATDEVGSSSARRRHKHGHRAICAAIEAGEVDKVFELLETGEASLNKGGKKGTTPLHFACRRNILAEEAEWQADNNQDDSGCDERSAVLIIQALLANGADIDELDNDGRTPLVVALEWSCSPKIRHAIALIDAGANLEIRWGDSINAETAVSLAVDIGDVDLWKAIIRRKAELDVSNGSGTMPLGFAAANDRVDLIELLVEGGANPSARVAHDDEYDHEYGPMTPILIACGNLQLRAARSLLEKYVDADDTTLGDGDTCLHLVAEDLRPRPGRSVERLETAADLVELLLKWDADETVKNGAHQTPAELAGVGHLVGTPGPHDEQQLWGCPAGSCFS